MGAKQQQITVIPNIWLLDTTWL